MPKKIPNRKLGTQPRIILWQTGDSSTSVKKILKLNASKDKIIVTAHLRGMPPAPTKKKDTLILKKNSNANTINQTLNYVILDYF